VFFDDFKVEHIKSPIISSQDYYPFGLTFNSYQRENSTPNPYQYNGKELQNELDLGWLDFVTRMYMAEIGRWSKVDILSDKMRRHSPYNYAYDNPIRFIDPDGMMPQDNKRDNRAEHREWLAGSRDRFAHRTSGNNRAASYYAQHENSQQDKREKNPNNLQNTTVDLEMPNPVPANNLNPVNIFEADQVVLNNLAVHFWWFGHHHNKGNYHLRDIVSSFINPNKETGALEWLSGFFSSVNTAVLKHEGDGKLFGGDVHFIIQAYASSAEQDDNMWRNKSQNEDLTVSTGSFEKMINGNQTTVREIYFTNGTDRLVNLQFFDKKTFDEAYQYFFK
jgi:RHS repeat-associated protein